MRQVFLIFLFLLSLFVLLYIIDIPQSLFLPWEEELRSENILERANRERESIGLTPLVLSSNLSRTAKLKLEDMFKKQYFDDVSPKGKRITDFSDYNFGTIEESLIKGYFKSERDVVEKWMESGQYRGNLYNPFFNETGIATGYGVYKGQEIFIGVQVFAVPKSDCTPPDEELYLEINTKQERIEILEQRISEENIAGPNHPVMKEYEGLVGQVNEMVDSYNKQSLDYSMCLQKVD